MNYKIVEFSGLWKFFFSYLAFWIRAQMNFYLQFKLDEKNLLNFAKYVKV